jgi:tetratricopeptide (TPR) repeat protein
MRSLAGILALVAIFAAAATAQVPAPAALQTLGSKPDALLLFRQGRDLDAAGKIAEAQAKYAEAVTICDLELAEDGKRLEAYVVKCWSLFRLGRHQEVVAIGTASLKIQYDARIAEVMGESYYYLGQMDSALKYLQKYIETAGDTGDRGPTAYFFMGEAYLRQKRYAHADMAYSLAVAREPNMPRWWFRLGSACESLAEYKRALDSYAKALALNPTYQEALDAQARVKPKAGP